MAEPCLHHCEHSLAMVFNPRLSCHGYHIAEVSKMVWNQGN
jgi:hypothetical protein